MSIKSIFTNALMETAKECDTQRARVWQVYQDYSPEPANATAKGIQAQMDVYVSTKQTEVQQAADRQIRELEAFWEAQAKSRAIDANYQQSLATALQIIPAAINTASPADLKARLSAFSDDPLAIAALQGALASQGGNDKTHRINGMEYNYILPTDTRQERKETLLRLTKTVVGLLEEMKIQVKMPPNYAVENVRLHDFRIISGPPPIQSTLDYIAACTDDCTVYDQTKHYSNQWYFGPRAIQWDYGNVYGRG